MRKKNKYISRDLLQNNDLKRVGIDLDGTLARKVYPKDGIGEPMPGAKEAMEELQRRGYKIIIFSARPDADEIAIELWLNDHAIPFNKIKLGKPLFRLLIDDSAFHFQDWQTDLPKIKERLAG